MNDVDFSNVVLNPQKMLENIEILNLSQQKKEETIWFQNKFFILQSF